MATGGNCSLFCLSRQLLVLRSESHPCPQETYLMKHMSKHTVVEHLVSHHSPQRTESPGIPVRISLI